MLASMLPVSNDQNVNADHLIQTSQFKQRTKNQQWNLLSKSLELYFLWLLSMMVIYALMFAILLSIRRSKRSQKTTGNRERKEHEQTSSNTVISINDKDLYPILNLAGDQSSFYLKYLDVDKISQSKSQDSRQARKTKDRKDMLADITGDRP
ncbi:hypothetical protein ZYGM_000947 [Zygosaccharomyces mellis]|uniref:Uncharacterized protein n=1 Tax=Zygosaccharomyces mellis TaxID=42258 RepID=A0A4C2EBH5_9SACH|nr:hypothetical protein ZYGM_000947 [Zygosaccharomyces mellis]